MSHADVRPPARRALGFAAAALCFALATPWVLRPWFLDRDTAPQARLMGEADLLLNVWIVAWTAHAMLTDPARLFDGNIFHPVPNMIASSENMLAHLPFTVPVLAATGNALHLLKTVALESFVLAGLAMYALVFHHTRHAGAALVAGAAYAFAPWRTLVIPQFQYLGTQYLPLALLAVDCWLERRRVRALLGMAAALVLQVLACVYVGYFSLVTVPFYALAALLAARPTRPARAAAGIGGGFVLAGLGMVPAAIPYLLARSGGVVPAHDPFLVGAYSWPAWKYLNPVMVQTLGALPVTLVVLDVIVRTGMRLAGHRAPRWRAEVGLWVLVAVAALLSGGPKIELPYGVSLPSPYALLVHLPGFSSIRAPARFYVIVAAGVSALAGFATARWASRFPRPAGTLVAALLALVAIVEAAPRPAAVAPMHLGARAAPVHRWLSWQQGPGAVLELPSRKIEGDVAGNAINGRYMVASTIHWHPLLEGYTAYPPPVAGLYAAASRRLPDPRAFVVLVDSVDLRWIVVHRGMLWGAERLAWSKPLPDGLVLRGRWGLDEVYEVTRRPARPWRAQLLPRSRAPQPDSLEGTPTAPLAPACRQGRLAVEAPPRLRPAAAALTFPVRFENTSACTWPALGVRLDGLVGITYRWVSPAGDVHPSGAFTRLIADVPPGAVVEDTMVVFPPGETYGRWQLRAELIQHGSTDAIAVASAPVDVEPWTQSP